MADDDKLIQEIRDRMNEELENHTESNNEMLEDLTRRLKPGESAILAATEPASYEQMMAAIDDYEELFERTLDTDESGRLTLRD